jgi:hypothetical protein
MDLNQPARFRAPRPHDVDPRAIVHAISDGKNIRLMFEAVSAGLAFGSMLWWASVCLVSTFRPQGLSDPYWDGLPWLRTDTSGFAAFFVAAISLTCSEYLRLRRRHDDRRRAVAVGAQSRVSAAGTRKGNAPGLFMLLAVSETVIVLATGLVVYLSFNVITHPESLQIHVSHLLPWPAEGTLRVVALLLCVCSFTTFRCVRPLISRFLYCSCDFTVCIELHLFRDALIGPW